MTVIVWIRCFFLHSCCCSLVAHQGPDDLSPCVFLHIISLFSAVTAFNKKDTYRCSLGSEVNWFIFSSLGHYHTLTTAKLNRKWVSVHLDMTCKMYRSLCSLATICRTTSAAAAAAVAVAAAAVFLHPFSKCSSVAVAAAGWPSFPTPAEIWSFHSALLRWPRGRGRIRSPMRLILLFLILCLPCNFIGIKVWSSWPGKEISVAWWWSCKGTIGLEHHCCTVVLSLLFIVCSVHSSAVLCFE